MAAKLPLVVTLEMGQHSSSWAIGLHIRVRVEQEEVSKESSGKMKQRVAI
jgi:hypothetical protein